MIIVSIERIFFLLAGQEPRNILNEYLLNAIDL